MKQTFLSLVLVALLLLSCKNNRNIVQSRNIVPIDNIYLSADENEDHPPMFNGDWTGVEFSKYVNSNIIYPKEAERSGISGRVIVKFTIDVDGSLIDAKVVSKTHELLNAEALRIINSSPKWEPGIQKGKPVKVNYQYPFNFGLSK